MFAKRKENKRERISAMIRCDVSLMRSKRFKFRTVSRLGAPAYCSSSPKSCLIFEKSNSVPVPRLKISKTSKQVVSK